MVKLQSRLVWIGGFIGCALVTPAMGKRVVCVDIKLNAQGNPVENNFLSSHEGWERTQLAEGDVLVRGGALTDCLAMVANGDTLEIVCHGLSGAEGNGIAFQWAGGQYTGFGTGDGLMPIPEGFDALQNVTVNFCACYSANDPDGPNDPNTPLTSKILAAMGGHKSNSATGFMGIARTQVAWGFAYPASVDTAEEKAAYKAIISGCLNADTGWLDKAPTNRSDPPPEPNQLTCAQTQLNDCEDFTDEAPAPTMTLGYRQPIDLGAQGGGAPGAAECGLADFILTPIDDCPWDCGGNDDGTVSTLDLLAMLTEWGVVDSACDHFGTGVGPDHMLDLLSSWGTCP